MPTSLPESGYLTMPEQARIDSACNRTPFTIRRGMLKCLIFSSLACITQVSGAFCLATIRGAGNGSTKRPKYGRIWGSVGAISFSVTDNYLESCGILSSRERLAIEQNSSEFWGRPRTEMEIIDFVANAVFEDNPIEGKQNIFVLKAEPPLVVVRGMMSDEMCDEIIWSAVHSGDMERSRVGTDLEESNIRTSSTTWLRGNQCEIPSRTFAHRASRLSGLPPGNQENLQVVHYGPGQKFDIHTDHLNEFNDQGMARLATCLLYLNTAELKAMEGVKGLTGGETWFPEFDVKVKPERGSVVFWWNTLERPGSDGYDSDMYLHVDPRSRHAGLPVASGEKWVANRWIHPVDIGTGVRGY
eukprot:CAMPEP_0113528242 /NCGR_PEP_ID=MMETSP0015_2-20120614/1738_1 /TAXON_ID=2838 /ORGANISM="Odontella" /LENGTH=356 /DNA_ID=CAMNT_0000426757 /DNA_START=52 /DNA_END=1122 /DNA_ORIENTATION=+ /assembly_acc=CAM_ASM_000160